MLESDIEDKVCEFALVQFDVRNLKLNIIGNVGWPDRLFLIPGGRPLFIEFKAPGEPLEPRQKLIASILEYLKYDYACCDTEDKGILAISNAMAAAVRRGR